jgi:broad specificity phosphatase PhoE
MEQKWPHALWIVRHGQSAGNVARDAAEAASLPLIDIVTRDVDTPLSELGERQSRALGRWFAQLPSAESPSVVLCSPYARAVATARLVCDMAGIANGMDALVPDERLREKEFGIVDRLTKVGIRERYPSSRSSAPMSASSTFARRAERAGATASFDSGACSTRSSANIAASASSS